MDLSGQLRRGLVQKIESLRQAGVQGIPQPASEVPEPSPSTDSGVAMRRGDVAADGAAASRSAAHVSKEEEKRCIPTISVDQQQETLHILAQEVSHCTRCQSLAETRTQTVFGVGNPNARLVFFGEAPGADEDRLGEPFVGRAGQLLTKIIQACTLQREDVYILNVLKCRPSGNRNPTPEEAQNCRPFFEQQLDIIRPEFICCLGAIATTTLLETTESIGRLRGRFHDWRGIRVMATYHPAYLLRNPPAKRMVWDDMKMLMKEMGIEIND